MNKFAISAALIAMLALSGCAQDAADQPSADSAAVSATSEGSTTTAADESQSKELYAMDTVMTLTAYGPNATKALDDAAADIERLDALFSISSGNGDIKALNDNKSADLSKDSRVLLKRALEIAKDTGGLFDVTIEPVMEAWGFPTKDFRVPEDSELSELLSHVDYKQVQLDDDGHATIPADVEIDLGGIAKGYTSSQVMDIFKEDGVTSGIISLGGNVQALGVKPDGSLWRVGIQDPADTANILGTVEVEDKCVITSGGYQRYFEENGVHYHHIIDPRTGYPANNGLTSVSIVSDDGTLADGLSTSLFIMGKDDAIKFWQKHKDEFDAILVDDDGNVTITEGLEGTFTLADGSTPEVARS
ncbi:MAG: FAD:protein FMN transferase [Peptococcaceae bacterium]|nr:FAD:protein FMN transferase [Peptococcaceae bacterium]